MVFLNKYANFLGTIFWGNTIIGVQVHTISALIVRKNKIYDLSSFLGERCGNVKND